MIWTNAQASLQFCGQLGTNLVMTWKKISQQPREATTPTNINKPDEYFEIVSRIDLRYLNCFDESLIVLTTENRSYGCAYQICRYENKNSTAGMGAKSL